MYRGRQGRAVGWLCAVAVAALGCAVPDPPGDAPAATLPPEVSVRPASSGRWALAGGATLLLARDGALRITGPGVELTLAADTLALPAIGRDGRRVAFALRRADGFATAVATARFADGSWRGPRVIVDGPGTPDRVALSADGSRIAYVDAADGVAALWIVPFDGGAATQLTNRALVRDGPGPPVGFVPVPDRAPPRFAGDRLTWTAGGRRYSEVLP